MRTGVGKFAAAGFGLWISAPARAGAGSAQESHIERCDKVRHLGTFEREAEEDLSRLLLEMAGKCPGNARFFSRMSRFGRFCPVLPHRCRTPRGVREKYVSYFVPNCPISLRLEAASEDSWTVMLSDGHGPGQAATVSKPGQSHLNPGSSAGQRDQGGRSGLVILQFNRCSRGISAPTCGTNMLVQMRHQVGAFHIRLAGVPLGDVSPKPTRFTGESRRRCRLGGVGFPRCARFRRRRVPGNRRGRM